MRSAQAVGPLTPFLCLRRYPSLVWQLSKREVETRYRGSVLGILWSLFHPILMLGVFTFVFGVVFKARWGGLFDDQTEFALMLFAGLIVFWLFSDCLARAPGLIRSNVSYVKKVVFPLEVLPWTVAAGALFHTGVSLLVLIVFHLVVAGPPPWTIVFFPLVLAPFLLLLLGLTWILASLGVYLPDVGQIVTVALTAALFLSPTFYPTSALPDAAAALIYLNPLSLIVEQSRAVLIWGRAPDWAALALYGAVAWGVAWLGIWWFQGTRKGFADVL